MKLSSKLVMISLVLDFRNVKEIARYERDVEGYASAFQSKVSSFFT